MYQLFPNPYLNNPRPWQNMRIGLMGGTFNPPHSGHVNAAQTAMQMLRLDAIWWLVTPASPFKKGHKIADIQTRMEQSRQLITNPRIIVSDLECQIDSLNTFDTLDQINAFFPYSKFIWIAGYDNAINFHHWENWRFLPHITPFCFIARPPVLNLTENCPLRIYQGFRHQVISHGGQWPLDAGRVYYVLQMQMDDNSSTKIRAGL